MTRILPPAALSLALTLTACMSIYKPVPDGYAGPTARIADSVVRDDGSQGRVFYVDSIDGHRIDSALTATRQASEGHGLSLTLVTQAREVPARPLRLHLVATSVAAEPIHELFKRAAGTFFEVEGDVDFTPAPGRHYVVTGELKKGASSVWIADEDTRQAVSVVVTEGR